MTHNLFGKLKYKDEYWLGQATLPAFAAVGERPEPEPLSEAEGEKLAADLTEGLDGLKDRMKEKFGDAAAQLFDALQREMADDSEADEDDPRAEARRRKQAERAAKKTARLARGAFPVRILDPDEEGPTEQQEAAFRHLIAAPDAVFAAVTSELFESFKNAYSQEHWRQICDLKPARSLAELTGQYAIERIEIHREHHNGTSYLVFPLDTAWNDEHGLMVVYHPDKPAAWTTYDGLYELIESDEPIGQEPAFTPSPSAELVNAIRAGDDTKARRLIDAGMDINALAPDEYPPLWIAVDQLATDEVRRLLQYGADPNLKNPDEKTTPLRHAKKMYRDMGFGPSKKKDPFLDSMMALAREVAGEGYANAKERLEEIMRLLEGAGGK